MGMAHKGVRYMGSALSLLMGAGAALGSTYLASRIKEKQDVESRLDRLEQMLAELGEARKGPKTQARKAPARKAPAKKAKK